MTPRKVWLPLMLSATLLGGCASTTTEQTNEPNRQLLLATPRQADPQIEIQIAKISSLLTSPELNEAQRAELLYDRGVRYDTMGLRTLARIDFNQSMKLKPDDANVFNFLGIYATQASEFDRAYESFDAVLELDPEYNFAYLNRGIASYYGDRNELALIDFTTFYNIDRSDAYRVIWLYLAETQANPETAKANLEQRIGELDSNNWATDIARYYLGDIDATELLNNARQNLSKNDRLVDRLCEAYFYIGKQARLDGEPAKAINLYKLALATNVYEFVEHRYALLEMRQIAEEAIAQAQRNQNQVNE